MVWNKTQHHAYICRFGRQSYSEVLGRKPTSIEWKLFSAAISEILDTEYAAKPAEFRNEDD